MMVQLMNKLETYTARRAVVPIRLQSTEEEELPDEIDTVSESYQLLRDSV